MTRLPDIASLWIGDRLSWLEQLCLKSFADAGHRVRLYSYAGIDNLPEGVLAGDANDIFPGEPMYRHAKNGSPAIHADLFRLNLLARTESIWVDADMYCLRPFDLGTPFVFGWEKPGQICNAVLGLPPDSKTLRSLLTFFEDEYAIAPWLKPWQRAELMAARDAGTPLHMTQQPWGFTGPASVTHFLQETGEIAHAQPQEAFYPVSFKDRNHLIQSKFHPEDRMTDATYGVHFWARRMKPRLEEKEHNRPRRGSFMDKLLERHGIDPKLAPIPGKPKPETAREDDPVFRAEVALAAVREEADIDTLARRYLVEPDFVIACRDRMLKDAHLVFDPARGGR